MSTGAASHGHPRQAAPDAAAAAWQALPWLALLVAFSPVLVDLAETWDSQPKHRYGLLAPLLFLWAWWSGPTRGARQRGLGALLVATAVVLELVGIAGGSWSLARAGLPLALLGLALLQGAPPAATAALLLWLTPIPDSVLLLASPALESAWAQLTGALLAAGGLDVRAVGPGLQGEAGRLDLLPGDGGLLLAHLLAALGWFLRARRGASLAACLRSAVAAAFVALPCQALAVLIAGALIGQGLPGAARDWLTYGLWPLATCVAVAWGLRRRAEAPRARPTAADLPESPAAEPPISAG